MSAGFKSQIFISLSFLVLVTSTAAASAGTSNSAYRDPQKDSLEYRSKSLMNVAPEDATAQDLARPYNQIRLPNVTEWANEAELVQRFKDVRDRRWLTTDDHPGFLRRSSWLYPDDGCFARAGLMIFNLVRNQVTAPHKIFVFGNLQVATANSLDGEVTWWYHVAPIVQVGVQKYVLDPAIEPRRPLAIDDWLSRMSQVPGELEVAICNSGAYGPMDPCSQHTDGVERAAHIDQPLYLRMEWGRLNSLNRKPELELGDNPPWLL